MCPDCNQNKLCTKCYKRDWYLKNREKILINQKQRRIDDPTHFKKLDNKKYRKKHPIPFVSENKWKDPEYVKNYRKQYYLKNKDKLQKRCKKFLDNNPDKKMEYYLNRRKWAKENPIKVKHSSSKYKKSNLGKLSSKINCNKRRVKKLNAQPKWVNEFEIKKIYEKCPKGMEVDHIIPIQGKNVSGLHVPWNLQYLTPEENQKKSNKLILP